MPIRPSIPRAASAFVGAVLTLTAAHVASSPLMAQSGSAPGHPDYERMTGSELYREACANCHGIDGTGADPSFLAFEEEVPDFTECTFASREPDADWVAVAHDGGPARGFSRMMPAFGGVLNPEQLQRVMDYVRTLCGDDAWPRGELNLPRALFTEKAYPEDEAVWEMGTPLESGAGSVMNTLVWEQRFGARSQIEVLVPFGVRQRGGTEADSDEWIGGMGDLTLGVKHALFHSRERGSILSLGAEVKLPTGKEDDGFGNGYAVWEAFASWGQILPAESFLQFQGVFEAPANSDAPNEAVLRGGLGRTFTHGAWGRAWSPMVEVQAKRELADGEEWGWDLIPQLQVTLNTRQHVQANIGVLFPLTDADIRRTGLYLYVLWDWFDGGFFEGW